MLASRTLQRSCGGIRPTIIRRFTVGRCTPNPNTRSHRTSHCPSHAAHPTPTRTFPPAFLPTVLPTRVALAVTNARTHPPHPHTHTHTHTHTNTNTPREHSDARTWLSRSGPFHWPHQPPQPRPEICVRVRVCVQPPSSRAKNADMEVGPAGSTPARPTQPGRPHPLAGNCASVRLPARPTEPSPSAYVRVDADTGHSLHALPHSFPLPACSITLAPCFHSLFQGERHSNPKPA